MSESTIQISLGDLAVLLSKSNQHKSKSLLPPGTYVIARCRDAGVHAGEYVSHRGREVVLKNSRRIRYWKGAQTLSDLSQYGAGSESQIAPVVPTILLSEFCELLVCSPAGEKFLREAKEYKC